MGVGTRIRTLLGLKQGLARLAPHLAYIALALGLFGYTSIGARELHAINLLPLVEIVSHAAALKGEASNYLDSLSESDASAARQTARAKVIARLETIRGLRNFQTEPSATSREIDDSFAKTYQLLSQLDPSQAGYSPAALKAAYRTTLVTVSKLQAAAQKAASDQTSLLRNYATMTSLLLFGALAMGWAILALVVKLRSRNRDLFDMATNDTLTGLPSRRSVDERMTAIASSRRGTPLSVAVVDIDHFKRINDAHGHPAGDAVLISVADGLREACRAKDFVARMGGEEFIVLLPVTSEDDARVVCERIRQTIAARDHGGIPATVSIGFATSEAGQIDIHDLYRLADQALYVAKRAGRNQVSGYRDGMAMALAA